jgi:hypothetical protein
MEIILQALILRRDAGGSVGAGNFFRALMIPKEVAPAYAFSVGLHQSLFGLNCR